MMDIEAVLSFLDVTYYFSHVALCGKERKSTLLSGEVQGLADCTHAWADLDGEVLHHGAPIT